MSLANVILLASMLAMGVCVVIGIRNLRGITGSTRLYIVQAGLALAAEIAGLITRGPAHNNHYVFNVYVFAEFFLILFAARDYLGRMFIPLAIPSGLLFVATFGYDLVHTGPFYAAFHAFTAAWVLLGTVYLVLLIRQILQNQLSAAKGVILLAGILLTFYFCSIPRWSLLRYIIESFSSSAGAAIGLVTISLSLLRYSVTAVALWMIATAAKKGGGGQNRLPSVRRATGVAQRL